MSAKTIEQKINQYDEEIKPFNLVALDGGKYSLCLHLNYLEDDFGQNAFDNHARSKNEPVKDKYGYVTYGSGYDWEAAFREAFKDDPNLKQILFDCEGSAFFCDCHDLDLLADFGKRFKEIVLNDELFTQIVSNGINNYEACRREEERIRSSVRGHVINHPMAEFLVRAPQGDFCVKRGEGVKLLDGSMPTIKSISGKGELPAEDFLDLKVTAFQKDLFSDNLFKIVAEPAQEPVFTQSIKQ